MQSPIPFPEDSKLIKLLQDSLQGNYKTSFIITCFPDSFNYQGSLNSLQFSQLVKSIKTKATLNIKGSIESYKKEIQRLKLELKAAKSEKNLLIPNASQHGLVRCVTFMEHKDSDDILINSPEKEKENSSNSIILSKSTTDDIQEIKRLTEINDKLEKENYDLKMQIQELKESFNREMMKKIAKETESFENQSFQYDTIKKKMHPEMVFEILTQENLSLMNRIQLLQDHINTLNERISFMTEKIKKGEKISD